MSRSRRGGRPESRFEGGAPSPRTEAEREVGSLDEWELGRRFQHDRELTTDAKAIQKEMLLAAKHAELGLPRSPQINLDLLYILDKPAKLTRLKHPHRHATDAQDPPPKTDRTSAPRPFLLRSLARPPKPAPTHAKTPASYAAAPTRAVQDSRHRAQSFDQGAEGGRCGAADQQSDIFREFFPDLEADDVDELRAQIILFKSKKSQLQQLLDGKKAATLAKAQRSADMKRTRKTFLREILSHLEDFSPAKLSAQHFAHYNKFQMARSNRREYNRATDTSVQNGADLRQLSHEIGEERLEIAKVKDKLRFVKLQLVAMFKKLLRSPRAVL